QVNTPYGHEYLGVKTRLVITPLTERCYISIVQAVGMYCAAAPMGQGGVGKTATTKDLGHMMGRLVMVFNCSEQVDIRAMGKIMKGLAMAGVWGCLVDLPRIHTQVLSVAAQQL
ncbi:hydrolytic ATP binding site of dynein motor region D1-domain-containing protein, partial [Baffinella frigidus]